MFNLTFVCRTLEKATKRKLGNLNLDKEKGFEQGRRPFVTGTGKKLMAKKERRRKEKETWKVL